MTRPLPALLAALPALAIGTALLAQQAKPAAPRPSYNDPALGFSLEAPRFPAPASTQVVVPIVFSAPSARVGFTSNVNVNIQPIKTDRDAYLAISRREMDQRGFTMNEVTERTVSGRPASLLDYQGRIRGESLRFLALAVIDKERVILVTCAASAADFPALEPEFRACLDSFKMPR